MAEPLKNVYDRAYIERLAQSLEGAGLEVDQEKFCDAAMADPWDELELKQRTSRLREMLAQVLPAYFPEAVPFLLKAGKTFGGYEGMFFPEYVEVYGLDHWESSMAALEVLTTYSSAEFAIRPFLQKEPVKGMQQMQQWATHSNEHVRRLASEGCRPLLPWASQLKVFRENPGPLFEILALLKKDESLYVRKSVANNLNDISKDHPELALKWAKEAIANNHPHTQWIVKHGLRTLLKEGEGQAMSLFGYAKAHEYEALPFHLEQKEVSLGEKLFFSFDLEVKKESNFRFEYALYFLKKNGTYTHKVFKICERELLPGEYEVSKEHFFKIINTRVYYEGLHFIEPIINGVPLNKCAFSLWLQSPAYAVYMMLTQKNTLYTGITTDLSRRFKEHRESKKGAKYTKANRPHEVVFVQGFENRSVASKKESEIKKLTRAQKEKLAVIKYL